MNLQAEMSQLEQLKEDAAENIDPKTFKNSLGLTKKDTLHIGNLPYHYREEDI